MRALLADIGERLRIEAVDLDPEHVEIGDLAQDLQKAFGLGVEVEVEQDIDIGSGSFADRFQMHAQVAQYLALDIELGLKRRAEAGPPAGGLAAIIGEDVGLECGEFLLAYLAADRLDTVEAFDRGLVPGGMIDPPGRAMRPVDANTVADLAAEELVAGHAQQLGLGIEHGVLDRTERLRDHAAGGRTRRRVEFGVGALMLVDVLPHHARREALDRGAHARRAEALVIFAPADCAVFGRELDEMVIPPAGVAGEQFGICYFGRIWHGFSSALPALFFGLLSDYAEARAADPSPGIATRPCRTRQDLT